MDCWIEVTPHYWRKEADLPLGHAVAEIRKHPRLAWYSAHVEVACAAQHLPENIVKSMLGLPTQAEAQRTCNNFLAECVAADLLGAAGFD